MAQNEVYNYLRSEPLGEPPKLRPMPWAGEYRFVGGRQHANDESPLDTVVRNLVDMLPGIDVRNPADIAVTLSNKAIAKNRNNIFHVYTFVAFVGDNPKLQQLDVELVNSRLAAQRQQYWDAVSRGSVEDLQRARQLMRCRIHRVEWLPVDEAIERLNDEGGSFVNEWQRREFLKWGFSLKRQLSLAALQYLQTLRAAGTQERVLERCVETVIRQIASTKNMSEKEWREELFARSGITEAGFFDVNRMRLLSYNLNMLPAMTIGAGPGHGYAAERMTEFIERMKSKNVDLLCVQEVFATPFMPWCLQRRFLREMKALGFQYHVKSGLPTVRSMLVHRKWTDSGLIILSKFKIVEYDKMMFSVSVDLDAGASKGVIYAKIEFGGRFLLVFNTHLQATHTHPVSSFRDEEVRHQQLLELSRFIKTKSHFSPGSPWLLAGDFNVDAIASSQSDVFGYSWDTNNIESNEYRFIVSMLSRDPDSVSRFGGGGAGGDDDTGMVDVLKEAFGGHPSTRPPRLQLPTSVKYMVKHKFPQRLDYVFFTPGSLGEIHPIISATTIDKFEANPTGGSDVISPSDYALWQREQRREDEELLLKKKDKMMEKKKAKKMTTKHSSCSSTQDGRSQHLLEAPTSLKMLNIKRTESGFSLPNPQFQAPLHTAEDDSDVEHEQDSEEDWRMNPHVTLRPGQLPRQKTVNPLSSLSTGDDFKYLTLSDHYAISVTLQSMNTFQWGNSNSRSREASGNVVARASTDPTSALSRRQLLVRKLETTTRRFTKTSQVLLSVFAVFFVGWKLLANGLEWVDSKPPPLLDVLHMIIHGADELTYLFGPIMQTSLVVGAAILLVALLTFAYIQHGKQPPVAMRRQELRTQHKGVMFGRDHDHHHRRPNNASHETYALNGMDGSDHRPIRFSQDVVSGDEVDVGSGRSHTFSGGLRSRKYSRGVRAGSDGIGTHVVCNYEDAAAAADDDDDDYGDDDNDSNNIDDADRDDGDGDNDDDDEPVYRSPWSPEELISVDRRLPHVTTLYEMFMHSVEEYGYRECLGTRSVSPKGFLSLTYEWITYDQVFRRVRKFGSGLLNISSHLTVERGDRIGLLSENRSEWVVADLACFSHSLVSVPLIVSGIDLLMYMLRHSGVKVVICSQQWTPAILNCIELSRKAKQSTASVPASECRTSAPCSAGSGSGFAGHPNDVCVQAIIQMERIEYEELSRAEELGVLLYDFRFVEKKGAKHPVSQSPPDPEDVATVVYRARINGEAAGSVLTHSNLLAQLASMDVALSATLAAAAGGTRFSQNDVHFSYVPLASISERMMLLYALYRGMGVGFQSGDYGKVFDDMRVLQPTFIIGNGRIFSDLYARFKRIVEGWTRPYRFFFSLVYNHKRRLFQQGKFRSHFWDRFLFRSFARLLGGNIRCIFVVDGVPEQRVSQFMQICFCCPMIRGFAFPETGGLVSLGGVPMPANEIKLVTVPQASRSSEFAGAGISVSGAAGGIGELCVRGNSVFMEYFADDELTDGRLDREGWWHSGHVCEWKGGKLSGVGTLSSFMEVSPGQWVNLVKLEMLYARNCPLAHQVWVHGQPWHGQPITDDEFDVGAGTGAGTGSGTYPNGPATQTEKPSALVAVVAVDHEMMYEWSKGQRLHVYDIQAICNMPEAKIAVLDSLESIARKQHLRPVEYLNDVVLTPITFNVHNSLMTSALQLRRQELRVRFEAEVAEMLNAVKKL